MKIEELKEGNLAIVTDGIHDAFVDNEALVGQGQECMILDCGSILSKEDIDQFKLRFNVIEENYYTSERL